MISFFALCVNRKCNLHFAPFVVKYLKRGDGDGL